MKVNDSPTKAIEEKMYRYRLTSRYSGARCPTYSHILQMGVATHHFTLSTDLDWIANPLSPAGRYLSFASCVIAICAECGEVKDGKAEDEEVRSFHPTLRRRWSRVCDTQASTSEEFATS